MNYGAKDFRLQRWAERSSEGRLRFFVYAYGERRAAGAIVPQCTEEDITTWKGNAKNITAHSFTSDSETVLKEGGVVQNANANDEGYGRRLKSVWNGSSDTGPSTLRTRLSRMPCAPESSKNNHVRRAERRKSTHITTITISRWQFDGSAHDATGSTTVGQRSGPNSSLGTENLAASSRGLAAIFAKLAGVKHAE